MSTSTSMSTTASTIGDTESSEKERTLSDAVNSLPVIAEAVSELILEYEDLQEQNKVLKEHIEKLENNKPDKPVNPFYVSNEEVIIMLETNIKIMEQLRNGTLFQIDLLEAAKKKKQAQVSQLQPQPPATYPPYQYPQMPGYGAVPPSQLSGVGIGAQPPMMNPAYNPMNPYGYPNPMPPMMNQATIPSLQALAQPQIPPPVESGGVFVLSDDEDVVAMPISDPPPKKSMPLTGGFLR